MMQRVYGAAAVLTGAAALAVSWWSLYSLGILIGIPAPLAAGLSLVFDLAALTCVGLAERVATSPIGGSALGPRIALAVMLLTSVYLNVRHAELTLGAGWITGAVAYAMPAVVAAVLLELHLKFRHREVRQGLGRLAPALPTVGWAAALLFPRTSVRTVRRYARAHLARLDAAVDLPPAPAPEWPAEPLAIESGDDGSGQPVTSADTSEHVAEVAEVAACSTDADAIRLAGERTGSTDVRTRAQWLHERGRMVTTENVRAVLNRDGRHRAGEVVSIRRSS